MNENMQSKINLYESKSDLGHDVMVPYKGFIFIPSQLMVKVNALNLCRVGNKVVWDPQKNQYTNGKCNSLAILKYAQDLTIVIRTACFRDPVQQHLYIDKSLVVKIYSENELVTFCSYTVLTHQVNNARIYVLWALGTIRVSDTVLDH